MFVVTLTNCGVKFWLRGTTWAFIEDRANKFVTEQAAIDALAKAKKFMRPAMFKLAKVQEIDL